MSNLNNALSFTSLNQNRFLYLMGLETKDIDYMSSQEISLLREDIEILKGYFSKKNLPFTNLFISSVKGKIGAINSRLLTKRTHPL